MRTSESIVELADALSKAQGELKHAAKSAENPFFKSHYADLAGVTDACRGVLAKNGLSVIHGAESTDGLMVTVTCRLMHKSGQWIETALALKPTKSDPQGMGSAITYARRYTLAAIVGVATEDDDGNAASAPVPERATRNREVPAQPPKQSGPSKTDVQTAVVGWLKIGAEDVPGVVNKIKINLGIPPGPLAAENIPKILAKVAELNQKGVDLNSLNDALAKAV